MELKWAIFALVKDFLKALLLHLPHHFFGIYYVTAMAYIPQTLFPEAMGKSGRKIIIVEI